MPTKAMKRNDLAGSDATECRIALFKPMSGGWRRTIMTEKTGRARMIGIVLGIAVLIVALLLKRLLR